MKVAIYGHSFPNQDLDCLTDLLDELSKIKALVFFEEEFYDFASQLFKINVDGFFNQERGLDEFFNLFVSFGGDGTMLRAATYIKDLNIPIVGVNTGRLGFLSTFKKDQVRQVVSEFISGAYTIEERSLIEAYVDSESFDNENLNFALNEVTVSRKDTTSMITVETYLNGEYLTAYWADGLIVSTPTGSTGYSLSCGGPVIAPDAKSLVLTPIAPHNLNARPLVISDETEIRLIVTGREENHLLSLDSRITTLTMGKEITIKKAPFTLNMIEYKSESFLKTLRNKLLWGQDKRN